MPIENCSSTTTAQILPPNVRAMVDRLRNFETVEGRTKGLLSYKPRPNDVVISTSPKCGTTWMQQICHQLRAGGEDMSFGEISQVVPFLELAYDCGINVEQPQRMPSRRQQQQQQQAVQEAVSGEEVQEEEEEDCPIRLFKTHAWAEHCPPFPRTIVVLRNPHDTLVSFYRFFEDWFFPCGDLTLKEFATYFWLNRGTPQSIMENASYFVHLISWYEKKTKTKNNPNVLFVCFEDLKDDLEGQVRRIAKFLLPPSSSSLSSSSSSCDDDDLIRRVTERSTFAFMKAHESQFDEHLTKFHRNAACGLPARAGMDSTKIVHGKVGSGKLELPPDIVRAIDQKWNEVVYPVTKCATYDELRQKLRELQ